MFKGWNKRTVHPFSHSPKIILRLSYIKIVLDKIKLREFVVNRHNLKDLPEEEKDTRRKVKKKRERKTNRKVNILLKLMGFSS